MLMRDMQGVRSFQFVQEARKSVKVFLAVADDFDSAKEVPRIAAYVRDRLGPTVESNVQFVDRLEAEKSGKFRYVICKVTNQP